MSDSASGSWASKALRRRATLNFTKFQARNGPATAEMAPSRG